ncbi:hypothetical protein N5F23_23930 [Pseudomonas sichuanensis]|uniref:hypothetical protein n=1 Tax=Pseudomonas sichuanensis TaxID=2213015 RepID=UPI00244A1754|nr:hypothetical protein [Pseudomonas sichuanensis]MDH0732387.1 hypothetical protein [Pseudomonas sichuanensis]MDH1585646.1 hypothetical protein [Pseudomonas sichuanensis]MDH1595131.1 hypothetical protein [Pseudomonas sichuanensis]MDH1599756.1 hypothetical protein [Pseudomonas sichuanensis]
MAGNSKAELLNWLSADGRLLGNDMVFAIDKAKADALLTQEYIRRFNTQSYLAPVSGETREDNGYKVYLQGFVLDHPRLSFDNVDITSSKASLRMKIVSGGQVNLKKMGAYWYPQRMDVVSPLVGPELRLKLELNNVPGFVDDDGRILLDLKDSSDFELTFSDSNRLRELGGDFFKELFMALPPEKRCWSIGKIEGSEETILEPETFSLYTQRNPAIAYSPLSAGDQDIDGALLGMVRMGGNSESWARPGPEYKYLIPTDYKDFSATVMFSWKRVVAAAIFGRFKAFGVDSSLVGVVVTENFIEFTNIHGVYIPDPDSSNNEHIIGILPGFTVPLIMRDEFSTSGKGHEFVEGTLRVTYEGDNIGAEFNCSMITHYIVEMVYESYRVIDVSRLLGERERRTDHRNFRFEWELSRSTGELISKGGKLLSEPDDIESVHDPLRGVDYVFERVEQRLVMDIVKHTIYSALGAIGKQLISNISMPTDINEVLDEILDLNGGRVIQGREYHLPKETVCFGQVDPKFTTFTVTPLEKTIVQGESFQFATVPVQQNVQWHAEAVEGSSDEAGKFDPTQIGLYWAPKAESIEGAFSRVRITATHPPTGYKASALITVVKNALSLSPLVEVCQVGDTGVSLKAGHASGGELQWRILGAQPHGRLAHSTGTANTYIPGGNVTGKAFVVEEVEVRNSQADEQRTLCVVTAMTDMRPSDVLVDKQDVQLGRLWLSLSAAGQVGISSLSVVHGPGQIAVDGDGKPYYQVVNSSPADFCVVRAFWEPMPGMPFVFEGFIVLPLPLVQHTAAYQALEQAAQRTARRT